MQNINHVVIVGRLTRDPELRATASGTSVINFSLAVNESRKNQRGQWEDYANFIDCTMWGNRAEALSKILTKGQLAAIDGRLHWYQWERDGQKRSKVEVVCEQIEVLSPKKQEQQPQAYPAPDIYGTEIPWA